MSVIKSDDINNINTNIYTLGTKAKISNDLTTNFQSAGGNNVNKNDIISPVSINEIKNAINILETKFSLNCCQANCNSTFKYTYKSGTLTNYTTVCQNQCITNTAYYYNCGGCCMD